MQKLDQQTNGNGAGDKLDLSGLDLAAVPVSYRSTVGAPNTSVSAAKVLTDARKSGSAIESLLGSLAELALSPEVQSAVQDSLKTSPNSGALTEVLALAQLLAKDCAESERSEKSRRKSGSVKAQAEYVGTVIFLSELAQKDPGLLEAISELTTNKGETVSPVLKRVEAFWDSEKHGGLLIGHTLLVRELREKNTVTETHLLRGLLKPYFQMTEGQAGIGELFHSPKKEFAHLKDDTLNRKDSKLLEIVLTSLPGEQIKNEPIYSRLSFIFSNFNERKDILETLEALLDAGVTLSVKDLHFLLENLPRGQSCGKNNGFADLRAAGLEANIYGFPSIRPTDLRVLWLALQATTLPEGKELLGSVADLVRRVVRNTHVKCSYSYESGSVRDTLEVFFNEELRALVKRILV